MDGTMNAGRTLQVNGLELYFEERGEGPPLLLLHGFMGCGRDFRRFGEAFAGYRSIAPDLRGHGRSSNPSGRFVHRDAATDVLALLDALNIDRCRAIGISGGGNVLMHMASRAPERIEAMVLVSSTTHFPDEARAFMASYTLESCSESQLRQLRQIHPQGDEQIGALYRQAQQFKDSHDDMCFEPSTLAEIRARTLIVYGDHDPLYPVEIAVAMYRAIPRASLWIIPDAGHAAVFGELRERFATQACAFLNVGA